MRWQETAENVLRNAQYEIVDVDGVSDYSGWGCVLAKKESTWATLSWSYGSCSWCDGYEDMSEEDRHQAFSELIDNWSSEEEARRKFNNSKGW